MLLKAITQKSLQKRRAEPKTSKIMEKSEEGAHNQATKKKILSSTGDDARR